MINKKKKLNRYLCIYKYEFLLNFIQVIFKHKHEFFLYLNPKILPTGKRRLNNTILLICHYYNILAQQYYHPCNKFH